MYLDDPNTRLYQIVVGQVYPFTYKDKDYYFYEQYYSFSNEAMAFEPPQDLLELLD